MRMRSIIAPGVVVAISLARSPTPAVRVRDDAAQFGSRSPRCTSITTVGLRPTDPIGQQTGQRSTVPSG
jgi:hypothetical protein